MDQLPFSLPLPWSRGESLQKMAASGASPLIRHALKKKPGKRKTGVTTGVRQQEEELVHAVKDNPRANQLRVESHSGSADHSAAPGRVPVYFFSLLDRARPVFFFSSGRKRENGGCIAPAIAGCHSTPPARASTGPPQGPLRLNAERACPSSPSRRAKSAILSAQALSAAWS